MTDEMRGDRDTREAPHDVREARRDAREARRDAREAPPDAREARGDSRGSILITGGSGRLGRELQELISNLEAPSRSACDVTDPASLAAAFARLQPTLVVHAAAYTAVDAAERERAACWTVNVEGTRNVAAACRAHGAALVHISTDYVFWGDDGGYAEDDPPGPVRNFYALTKLVAEEAVRALPGHLVVRTSFRPREWPYPKAFDDVYTSQDYVDVIAPEIALAIRGRSAIPHDTLHIGTERKTVFELARRRRPDVQRGSKASVVVDLPDDISLDTSRWTQLRPQVEAAASRVEDGHG